MTLELLHTVAEGHSLTEQQAERAMRVLLAGESTPVLTAAFLTALRMKGESVHELTGFARAMRAAAVPLEISAEFRPLLDTCGTGGNRTSAFNISTVAAFVVAGAGVRVAKHGNRSLASKCGSADVLDALGVRTQVDPPIVKRSIEEAGIGFLFAPKFHLATRHVQPIRAELKIRSAFNFLGPLTNPAGVEMQVAGTWSVEAAGKIAGALARLGLLRAYVVHGSDGLGEVTITGPTTVFHVHDGAIEQRTISPEDFGLSVRPLTSVHGGDIGKNLAIAQSILRGEKSVARDVVLINAALALHTARPEWSFVEGVERAGESIDSGAAAQRLQKLREITMAG